MGKSERKCSLAEVKIKRWGAPRFIGRNMKISASLLKTIKLVSGGVYYTVGVCSLKR